MVRRRWPGAPPAAGPDAAATRAPTQPATSTQPATAAVAATTSQPTTQLSVGQRLRLRRLREEYMALLKDEKWLDARAAIEKVRALDPHSPMEIYNLACIESRLGHPDTAIKYLKDPLMKATPP